MKDFKDCNQEILFNSRPKLEISHFREIFTVMFNTGIHEHRPDRTKIKYGRSDSDRFGLESKEEPGRIRAKDFFGPNTGPNQSSKS